MCLQAVRVSFKMLCLYAATGTLPWNSAWTISFASSSFTTFFLSLPPSSISTKTPHSYILRSKWHSFKTQTFHCVRTTLTNTHMQHRPLLSTRRRCRRAGEMGHLPPARITSSTARGFATSPDTHCTRVVISHRPRALQTQCNYEDRSENKFTMHSSLFTLIRGIQARNWTIWGSIPYKGK